VQRVEVDAGQRPSVSSEQFEELKRLERENAELGRANEILKQQRFSSGPSSTGP